MGGGATTGGEGDGLRVSVARADGVKCPRCWRYTGEGRFNFDGLCDRCCQVLWTHHPAHESIPFIR